MKKAAVYSRISQLKKFFEVFLKKGLTNQKYRGIILKSSELITDERKKKWGFSSAGRASALQAEGHRFEPCSTHQFFGLVVQLVRTPACHAGGRQFESVRGRQHASVAQSVEQGTENPRVVGSIPTGSTKRCRPYDAPFTMRI